MIPFRVATYNVHKCRGMDWRISVPRIAKVLAEIDADALAIQEVFAVQAVTIAEFLRCQHVFGAARMLNGEPYGNAVFSRLAIRNSERYDLSVGGREPRGCLRLELDVHRGATLHLFVVHLGTSFLERRKQAIKLVSTEILDREDVKGRRIVAGDFNEWARGLATNLLSKHLVSADLMAHLHRRTTYPGLLPVLHLDHIYYDPAFQLTSLHLHRTAPAVVASDHLPLVGDFTISEGAGLERGPA